jgi:Spy/CpxP family protein refolding chaperone
MATGDPSILRIRIVTALIIAAVFLSGALVGAGIYRWGSSAGLSGDMPHGQGAAVWLPLEELDLTPEQDAKVSAVMDRHRVELDAIVRESFPRVRAINAQVQKEVRDLLTPEQQKNFDELKRRGPMGPTPTWQKRRDDFDGEPPPPPSGPRRRFEGPMPRP